MDKHTKGLSYEVKKRGDSTLVVFGGNVDEHSDFSGLEELATRDLATRGRVVFDLADIKQINSEGVRIWVTFIRRLGEMDLTFVRCSLPLVAQINMIKGFQGSAKILSFYAPYYCSRTGREEEKLLTVEQVPNPLKPPVFPCEGGQLELDEIPERYFAFLLAERKHAKQA